MTDIERTPEPENLIRRYRHATSRRSAWEGHWRERLTARDEVFLTGGEKAHKKNARTLP